MKITKLLLIGLAVIFFACSDDDDPKPTKEGLIGTWAVTGIDYAGSSTTTVQGTPPITSNFTGKGKEMALDIVFNNNPATLASQGSYIIALTVEGQPGTQDVPVEGFMADGTWELSGSTLTVTGANGPQTATIVEQTSTTLKMKWNYDYTMALQGASVVMKVKGTYTFKKK